VLVYYRYGTFIVVRCGPLSLSAAIIFDHRKNTVFLLPWGGTSGRNPHKSLENRLPEVTPRLAGKNAWLPQFPVLRANERAGVCVSWQLGSWVAGAQIFYRLGRMVIVLQSRFLVISAEGETPAPAQRI
jgi:hypothetical protein